MTRVREGDQDAFRQLFDAFYEGLCNYADRLFKDRDSAEEIVQDLFCRYWEKRSEIEISSSPKGYFIMAIKNRYLNKVKEQRVRQEAHREIHLSARSSQLEAPVFDLQNRINEAYELLPEQCRKVFRMSREEGLKYPEIANQLGLSIKTVENQMGKGLRIFRTHLKEYLPLLIISLIKWPW